LSDLYINNNLNKNIGQSSNFDGFGEIGVIQNITNQQKESLQYKNKMDRYNQQIHFRLLKLYLLTSLGNFQQVVIRGVC
jgi:SLT domain-containing protein